MEKKKLIRITTVPISLLMLLRGQLRFMSAHYEVIGVSSSGRDLNLVAENEGIDTIPIEMSREISPVQDLKSLWQLIRLFRKERPFIVHTHTPKAGVAGMLAAKIAGVPHRLHTVAGLPLLEVGGSKRKVLDLVEKLTYSCATKVYPNSFGLRDIILQNKYCAPEKLKVLANGSSNGIDTSFFDPALFGDSEKQEFREKLGIHPGEFVFIFVGRLVGDKGINELVDAFVQVRKSVANVRLLLVGPAEAHLDPLKPETNAMIASEKSIIAVGGQNEVRPYLAISDVLAFPSYREGFPNVVLQAGAMGLPAIVSDINGCNEIVVENENGMIVPVKNPKALADAMKRIATDNDLKTSLAANARRMIVSKYSRDVVWDAILTEYKNLEPDV